MRARAGATGDVMKYMLLIYGAEGCWTEDERRACMIESLGICDELADRFGIGHATLQIETSEETACRLAPDHVI